MGASGVAEHEKFVFPMILKVNPWRLDPDKGNKVLGGQLNINLFQLLYNNMFNI